MCYGIFVLDQHKVAHNCEVKGKLYIDIKNVFTNKNLKNMTYICIQPPWVNTLSNHILLQLQRQVFGAMSVPGLHI